MESLQYDTPIYFIERRISMKKIWKWIIGIVVGLIALIILAGSAFAFRMHSFRQTTWMMGRDDIRGIHEFGMSPFYGMHGYYGMMPFGGLLGGLFGLGILVLIVLGIIWLVRALTKPAATATPAVAAAPTVACQKCGKPLQEDWTTCPYCGKKR